MNVLLDECVPARLARSLTGHTVTTVPRRGWAGIKNGDLLSLAEKEFDIFVTVDKNLSEQQDVAQFDIAVVLIRSRSNQLEELQKVASELLESIGQATSRQLTIVGT